jgi:hypothetical protein
MQRYRRAYKKEADNACLVLVVGVCVSLLIDAI